MRVEGSLAIPPHPNPLPEGEGVGQAYRFYPDSLAWRAF